MARVRKIFCSVIIAAVLMTLVMIVSVTSSSSASAGSTSRTIIVTPTETTTPSPILTQSNSSFDAAHLRAEPADPSPH